MYAQQIWRHLGSAAQEMDRLLLAILQFCCALSYGGVGDAASLSAPAYAVDLMNLWPCAGGGLAFLGYLALLCQTLAACGQSVGCRKAVASMQQYEQLPVQEETHEVRKGPEPLEGGPAIVELTASTGNTV